jgi:hypothetical protein
MNNPWLFDTIDARTGIEMISISRAIDAACLAGSGQTTSKRIDPEGTPNFASSIDSDHLTSTVTNARMFVSSPRLTHWVRYKKHLDKLGVHYSDYGTCFAAEWHQVLRARDL